jgi:hypothetical protein
MRYWPLPVAAAVCLFAFGATSFIYDLELGSLNLPRPGYLAVTGVWSFLGSLAVFFVSWFLFVVFDSERQVRQIVDRWDRISDRRFLIAACGAAFAIPMFLRFAVLNNAPVTDDEAAYRFAAQLLATGRLWVESPPMKLFFDQNFMINDGRLYAVYFPGWPAILALGELAGAPALVNPTVSALTVIPLTQILTRLAGRGWSKIGILVFLSAPFIQIAAATDLSHTSCLAALAWALAMCLRILANEARWPHYAAFAAAFALAFCIRPHVALGLGLPMLFVVARALLMASAGDRWRRVVAFVMPASVIAVLFLATLWAQNGSPFRVGYHQYMNYAIENGLRFTTFEPSDMQTVAGFEFSIPLGVIRTAAGLYRLNFDLFGWPSSLAFALLSLLSVAGPLRLLLCGMSGTLLFTLLFQQDWGIDTFGPVHGFELSLPILVLTVLGAQSLTGFLQRCESPAGGGRRWRMLPATVLVSCVLTAWMGFIQVRLNAIQRITQHINQALEAPTRAGVSQAVVFAPWLFAAPCGDAPRHWVFFRPVNDPDFRNDVIWANHIDYNQDRTLATRLGRAPYLLRWTQACRVELLHLDRVSRDQVPPGAVRKEELSQSW